MRTTRWLGAVAVLGLALTGCGDDGEAASGAGGSAGAGGGAGDAGTCEAGDPFDVGELASEPRSCAYECPSSSCAEANLDYACQNLAPWTAMAHVAECGCWDGTLPAPVAGRCTATAPTGEALRYAGADPSQPGQWVLPDGRRLRPAGAHWVYDEADLLGGITTGLIAIPGTSLVVTVDTGIVDHAVRVVDTALVGASDPVRGRVEFQDPATLNSGLAFAPPDLLYVPTNDGVVQALRLDPTTGALTRDDAASLTLPTSVAPGGDTVPWYSSSVAVSPDGRRLLVAAVDEPWLLVMDLDPASATYRGELGRVDLEDVETFGVWFDPADPSGATAYVTMWEDAEVVELDLTDATAPAVRRRFAVGKDPQGLAFLDARWLAVGNGLGDSISLVDRTSGTVTTQPVDVDAELRGLEPVGLAWDAGASRLYAALAGINAVAAWDVDLTAAPPTLTPLGRFPTQWWPSGIAVLADGTVAVSSMRGKGTGPNPVPLPIGDGEISDLLRGGVQVVPRPDAAALTAGDALVEALGNPSAVAGMPTVDCPDGAADFPLPATNTGGPSPAIEQVFIIVRENKNFDSIFGDLPGVEGRADIMLKERAADMDAIWANVRTLARTFTVSDNYYTAAVQSTQGHVWATHGRTTDFNERTWAVSGAGRDARGLPAGGVAEVGKPEEGSAFDWLVRESIPFDMLGEGVGVPREIPAHNPLDIRYPGGPVQNIGYNDLEKACHFAGRLRATCDLGRVVYMTLTNDHAFGVSDSRATPEVYCAVNDEATGIAVDAITHSPLWPRSLIIITQDDPLQGGEHIDSHRTPFVLVSPWVKRGYVSKTHIDVASIHKLVAHVLGIPYPNHQVAMAGLPLDAFTSTPDYTPYRYTPRTWPLSCGVGGTRAEQELTESWDFSEVDEQPGLSAQVWRFMRGRQLTELSPRQVRGIEARRRQLGRAGAADVD